MRRNILIVVLGILLAMSVSAQQKQEKRHNQYAVKQADMMLAYQEALKTTQEALLKTFKDVGRYYPTQELKAIVTAYTPDSASCYPYDDLITAIGRDARLPGIAVDPKKIPYGSIVIVDGIPYLADDTGKSMRNSDMLWVDIRMKSHKEAVRHGKKIKTISVIPRRES